MTTIEPGVVERLVERLRQLAAQIDPLLVGGCDAALLLEAAAFVDRYAKLPLETEAAINELRSYANEMPDTVRERHLHDIATLLAQQQARIGEMKGDLVAAREISVIIERRASAGDDRIRRLEGAIQAMAAAIRPLRVQGEDYIWRPAARVLELADDAILDRTLAKDQP